MVVTITVSGYDVTTTYAVTIGVNRVSVLGSGGTTTTVATALAAALSATEYAEFREIGWESSGAVITGTASTAGTPFTAVSSVTGGAGTIGAVTTTVTNTSPNDVGDANNYSSVTLPISGDTLVIENGEESLKWNLDALAAVDLASLIVRASFTGDIALPTDNENGYVEYRATELALSTCTLLYEEQADNLEAGSRRYNVGSNACTAAFIGSGNGTLGQEVTWLRGTSTTNAIEANGASLAIAALDSHAAGLGTLNMVNGAVVRCGLGTTFTTATVKVTNSTLDVRSNIATLTVDGASSSLTCWNAMTVTTLSLTGPCTYNSSGTITTLNLYVTDSGDAAGVGSIDFSQDRTARTITNAVNMHRGTRFNDPNGTVTLSGTPDIQPVNCRWKDLDIDVGMNRGISVT